MRTLIAVAALIAAVAACAAGAPGTQAVTTKGPITVTATIEKSRFAPGEPVALTVTIRNTGSAPAVLEFSSGQRVDYVIRRGDREVWRWSHDRAFTQALGTLTLAPGEERRYPERWPQVTNEGQTVEPGTYAFVGIVTATGNRIEAGPVGFVVAR